jgi:hypothetical protein
MGGYVVIAHKSIISYNITSCFVVETIIVIILS